MKHNNFRWSAGCNPRSRTKDKSRPDFYINYAFSIPTGLGTNNGRRFGTQYMGWAKLILNAYTLAKSQQPPSSGHSSDVFGTLRLTNRLEILSAITYIEAKLPWPTSYLNGVITPTFTVAILHTGGDRVAQRKLCFRKIGFDYFREEKVEKNQTSSHGPCN
ncbi:hypothetical protein H5410_010745 [Solanum commersonii]|uniref:Uncharacterized protein n=1 Tax=Solanum commersonii TaxID=4109 RepID=A0A9J6AN99_SOLCO|nr:hypothetical protein H5410_010745 [Solanum commersonii]